MARRALANQVLERQLEIGHRVLVEKLAKLHLAQERAELRGVDREGLRAQLRKGRVAFVHEVRDVVEEKRRGERRRRACIDGVDAELARPDRREKPDEPWHVEDVLENLAIRLEDHGERLVTARDGEKIARALALLPERRALSRTAPRQEQRARRILAEACSEECSRRRAHVGRARTATAYRERSLDQIA